MDLTFWGVHRPAQKLVLTMSIIVQQDSTIYSFIIFLQIALYVSDGTLIHHQEHTQTLITISGTGRNLFVTVR